MTRDKALAAVNELPQEFELDALIERLVFVEKVEKGLKQLDEQKTVAHEHVKEVTKMLEKYHRLPERKLDGQGNSKFC